MLWLEFPCVLLSEPLKSSGLIVKLLKAQHFSPLDVFPRVFISKTLASSSKNDLPDQQGIHPTFLALHERVKRAPNPAPVSE